MTRRLPRIARVLAAATGAVGVLVMAAWIAGHPALARPLGGLAVRFNAAGLMTLLAIGLWFAIVARTPAHRRVALALGAVVGVVALATLVEAVCGVDLGIDQLIVHEPAGEPGTLPPGRMMPAIAVAFVFLAAALLAIDWHTRRGHRPAELLAMIAFLIGYGGLTDFAFGHQVTTPAAHLRDMPLLAAMAAMTLSLAVLFARPAGGFMAVLSEDAAGGGLVRRLLPVILFVPPLVGWLRLRGEEAGLYDDTLGTALMVTTTVLLLGAGLVWNAWSLNASDRRQRALSDERARMADQLKHANDFLDAIVEHLPLMIFMKEAERLTFVRFNRAGEQLLGLSRDALLGKTDYDFFPADQAEHFQAKDRQTLASGEVVDLEEPIDSPTGRRWLHTKKVGLAGPDGKTAFLLGISEDITRRRETEEELRRAKNAAEATSRELEAFSYSVSHDLRAPLRSIDGFSQALLEDHAHLLDETARQHLDRVRAAAQRMAELIDDLLELSRVTRVELERRPVDLTAVAREVAAALEADHPGRQVRCVIADGLTTLGDPRLIRVLFENLLGNAWKFTSRNPTATIEVGRDADGAFFVRDDGAGFDMTYADKLFGAFQRLHRESEFEGTGIGLATVHRIILRHGGHIRAEGRVGAGATFRFTLAP